MVLRSGSTVAASIVAVAIAACGGSVGSDPSAVSADSGTSDSAARADAGDSGDSGDAASPKPSGCPATAPAGNGTCASPGLACEYTAEDENCGKYTCDKGVWTKLFGGGGACAAPAGLVCPIPQAPLVGGPGATIDKSCDAETDCVLVALQSDCCGNTLQYAVNKVSLKAAQTYADTCQRTFPGCGCPSGPPKAETGTHDGGTPQIVASCTPTGCASRYVR